MRRPRALKFWICFGPFEISIPLPGGVVVDREKITGSYKDGFLIVILPKVARAERSVVHTIPVTGE